MNTKIKVELTGVTDLMFAAYRGDRKELLPAERMYLQDDGQLYIPAGNIGSMLYFAFDRALEFRYKAMGATKKDLEVVAPSVIQISPARIDVLSSGTPTNVSVGFGKGSPLYLDERKAGGSAGGGNNKLPPHMEVRPVLRVPWSVKFDVRLLENEFIRDEKELNKWFATAGTYAGLGAGRKIGFGRFDVTRWEISAR